VRIVAALGGNALVKRGERLGADVQRGNVARAAEALAAIAPAHELIVTHGNGPQVGLLAMQSEALAGLAPQFGGNSALDILVAESEGMIGYLIEQALESRLHGRQVVTLLTQVEVSRDDPAFGKPTKPIGPCYAEEEALRLERTRGWRMAPEGGVFRRVVPSPEPRRILELPAIRLLLASGAVVICTGGGGIPVEVLPSGAVRGVEAVIDKDLAAALLAVGIEADALLLLTDADSVYLGWGTPAARPIRGATSPAELKGHAFAPGSMKPKVEAACRFVEAGGKLAGIGRLEDATAILEGRRGTIVMP
jgi:carbamate kinase